MIPTKPPPTLKVPEEWSPLFRDFIGKCLVKNPEERTAADRLLQVSTLTRSFLSNRKFAYFPHLIPNFFSTISSEQPGARALFAK
jgi:serine/threonine protein kinase